MDKREKKKKRDIEAKLFMALLHLKEEKNKKYSVEECEKNIAYLFESDDEFRTYFELNGFADISQDLLETCRMKTTKKGTIIALKGLCDYAIRKHNLIHSHTDNSLSQENIDLDDTKMFSDELIDAVESKQEEDNVGQLLKEFVDGKPKNINPLTEIPEPQMRLYGFSGAFKSAFFDTEEELTEYVKTHNTQFGSICIMEYLGNVAGRSDVIRLTYKSGKSVLYTSVDEDGYGIYNNERSIYRGEFIWEYNHGSISEMYSAFRDRGIVFEDDTYAKIAERNRRLFEMFEEHRQGPVLTKKKNNDDKK